MFNSNSEYERQSRFSIRKFNVGVASVLIGSLLFLSNATVAAEDIPTSTTTTETSQNVSMSEPSVTEAPLEKEVVTPIAEEKAPVVASTVEVIPETVETPKEISTPSSRTVSVTYRIELRDASTNEVIKTIDRASAVETTDQSAKTLVSETVNELPAGYTLAAGQEATVSGEVIEGQDNCLVLKISKESAATADTADTAVPTHTESAPVSDAVTPNVDASSTVPLSTATETKPSVTLPPISYKVTYTDVDSNVVIYNENKLQTYKSGENPNEVITRERVDLTLPALQGYDIATTEPGYYEKVVANKDERIFNFNVRKVNALLAEAPSNESASMMRTVVAGTLTGSPSLKGGTISVAINSAGAEIPIPQLSSNTYWMNFSDSNAKVSNLGTGTTGKSVLKVGTKYVQELTPGYIVTAEVVELKPFAVDNTNVYIGGGPAEVSIQNVDTNWSHLYYAGMMPNGKVAFGSENRGANIGFTLKVTATYNGVAVTPTVVMADAEEAGPREVLIFKTDGTPFEIFANVKRDKNATSTALPDVMKDKL